MSDTISFPRGLTELAGFKRLRLRLKSDSAAVVVVFRLFHFLANSVRPGSVGFVAEADLELLAGEFEPDRALLADAAVVRLLRETGWLEDTDGGLVCDEFRRHNGALDPAWRPREQRGGVGKAFARTVRDAKEGAGQMVLLPPETWRLEEGRLLTSEEIEQVTVLVRTLDGILNRQSRQMHEGDWPPSLVRLAWAALEKTTLAGCLDVARHLALEGLVSLPVCPRTTELALQRWDTVVTLVRTHLAAKP